MNIVLASDSKYLGPAKVLLRSLTVNNTEPINVYLLHTGISLSEQKDFSDKCALFSDKIDMNFIEVDDSKFHDVPLAFGLPHTTYYRFMAPDLLPKTVDRALYLDCDIIINRSINEFYHMDFNNSLFVACEDIGVSVLRKYKFLTIFGRLRTELHNGKYFNAGVLLFNMALARQMLNLDAVLDMISKYRNYITFSDQDILNYLYGLHTGYVDYKLYNMGAGYVMSENLDWVTENSAIIHYYGAPGSKPWLVKDKAENDTAMNRLWWTYADWFEEYRRPE